MIVERGGLRKIKPDEPTPVLIDHGRGGQIGTVRSIQVEDVVLSDGAVAPWFLAFCDITDPPSWLERGTSVSWSHGPVARMELHGVEWLTKALIREVSILTPGNRPGEPLAQVSSVWDAEPTSSPGPVLTSDRTGVGDACDEDDYRPPAFDELQRKLGYRVDWDNFEAALADNSRPLDRIYNQHMAAKRAKQLEPGVIVRQCGRVLGVR